jgi:RNA polymerase sigma-70 factor (ECF subfamily)
MHSGTAPPNANTIKHLQGSDSDAFVDVFNTNKGKIYALCLRMTRNTAEAEDLAQDAFVQAYCKLSAFRGDSALSTWLYRIAVNTVLMHFRKSAFHQVSLDERSDRDGQLVRRECCRNDGHLSGTVNRIALTRAIQQLSPGYRTIFLLHDVHGYQHKDIADMLDCSTGNSKSQLHKARHKLRQVLARIDEAVKASRTGDCGVSIRSSVVHSSANSGTASA